jgi:hypothetical protein
MDFLTIYIIGLFGMFCHWFKKFGKSEIEHNIISYLFTNPIATLQALGTLIVALMILLSTKEIDYTTTQGFALIFLAGYGADSLVNSTKEES